MELAEVIKTAINPALAILPQAMDTPKARVIVLTTGAHESKYKDRVQVLNGGGRGPAMGFWQCERGGGVKGVYTHPASTGHLHNLCAARNVPFDIPTIWATLETDDVLAAGVARLLYYTDPAPLPATDDTEGAWKLYLRTWRPGAYDRGSPAKRAQLRAEWEGHHRAVRVVMGLK
ncbi:hypothetical protein J2W35_004966 [Variovorax boronicumulans]|uniref:hypothetical protein n=1 Tax=Variovorax boronicumulans TaxID=436515 RepID=UPI0027874F73|nr:hypothetical protein [Variovorax boronicumulans]MDQ0084597.1 hypothetical protein [Variovorax boronicumulans]